MAGGGLGTESAEAAGSSLLHFLFFPHALFFPQARPGFEATQHQQGPKSSRSWVGPSYQKCSRTLTLTCDTSAWCARSGLQWGIA